MNLIKSRQSLTPEQQAQENAFRKMWHPVPPNDASEPGHQVMEEIKALIQEEALRRKTSHGQPRLRLSKANTRKWLALAASLMLVCGAIWYVRPPTSESNLQNTEFLLQSAITQELLQLQSAISETMTEWELAAVSDEFLFSALAAE